MNVTGSSVRTELVVAAELETVWDLVTDVTRVGQWSPECVHTTWMDGADSPRPGARFSGRNRIGDFEWTVTNVVTDVGRPNLFAWVVLDDDQDVDRPSSSWRYELERLGERRTLVQHSFTHGPGRSGVTWMIRKHPDRAEAVATERWATLRQHMDSTLARMKAVAERPPL